MTILWLHAMAEGMQRMQAAFSWGHPGSTSSTRSAIAEAIGKGQCWKDHCKAPELEPLGLCKRHLEEMKRDPLASG